MEKPCVTFETNVWERDYRIILGTSRLSDAVKRCELDGLLSNRVLYINNVDSLRDAERMAREWVSSGVINNYFVVDEYADRALEFFNLTREELGVGYYYSIPSLVGLYLCETEFLLHFTGDSIPCEGLPVDWLNSGVEVLRNNHELCVFNLTWNHEYDMAKAESHHEDANFWYGYGFSDQMYLVRTADFRKPIYNCYHPASQRYPQYAGESFEKRVDSWMRNKTLLRATYRKGSYIHKNL